MEPQPLLTIDPTLLDWLRIVAVAVAGGFLVVVMSASLGWIALFFEAGSQSHITRRIALR